MKDDETRLKRYVFPIVGQEPLLAFEGEGGIDLAEKVIAALPSQLSAGTRRQVLQVMHRVLALAVYPARLLKVQPLPRGFVPKARSRRAKSYLYPSEDAKLLSCRRVQLLHRVFYGLLAREGLRASEALSLSWSDVDLNHGVLTLDDNKTEDPRAWALDDGVAEALRRWKKILGKRAIGTSRVLVDRSGYVIDPYEAARNLRADLALAGIDRPQLFEDSETRIPIRVHDLRASFVTVNLANGRSEAWITDRTGHRSSQMLHVYKRAARSHAELNLGAFAPLYRAIPELRELDE